MGVCSRLFDFCCFWFSPPSKKDPLIIIMAPSSLLFSSLLFLSFFISLVSSHARWTFPPQRSDDNGGLKEWPCGEGLTDAFGDGVPLTTISPGEMSVLFAETINHGGSPYRIALSHGGDGRYHDYVLFDHIPHNEEGTTPKEHQVEILIPDVSCTEEDRCALQLIQVMTDKFTEPCQPTDLENSCGQRGFVYFSCANVVITGSEDVSSLESIYQSWTNDDSPTPYVPNEIAKWVEREGEDGQTVWRLAENADAAVDDDDGGNDDDDDDGDDNTALIVSLSVVGAFLVLGIIGGIVVFQKRKNANVPERAGSGGYRPPSA